MLIIHVSNKVNLDIFVSVYLEGEITATGNVWNIRTLCGGASEANNVGTEIMNENEKGHKVIEWKVSKTQ